MNWLFSTHTVHRVALLEAQNRQLRDTVEKLYEYVRTGHNLPALPARSTGDDLPLLHDIVAYVNTLPIDVSSRHKQAQYQILRPKTTPTVSLPQSQPETSPFPTFVATIPQLDAVMASSMQQDPQLPVYSPAQMDYECPESRLNLQELWPLMEMDPVEAARLYPWLQAYTAK
ncbi:hypothetical protein GMOD_00004929 [Pyrenophora seminiperda CCB06]|uniref:Uncharacterized protein n=1 Tax=Pyrenophora seminiperda CCB06 TaxID=1302712 RepID=A0A3M7MHW8_9PLEO|nr:hypothetical protein GMOD_00004929 [Pyrenophora seminiperda CCB06]